MELTAAQARRVRYLLDDEWDGWADFDRVLGEMSAEELHAFADNMNWDGGGADRLTRVLDHPGCDRGTALLIYWRADPLFDLKYGSRESVEAALWPARVEEWDMMRAIERRLADPNGFATARIPYDPANDRGRDRTTPRQKQKIDARASLPAVVFQPVTGGKAAG